MPFVCSICEEEAVHICARCTKDACDNHLCEKCLRCSDCCECELALDERSQGAPAGSARAMLTEAGTPQKPVPEPDPDPEPEAPHPPPEPDPFPEDDPDSGPVMP